MQVSFGNDARGRLAVRYDVVKLVIVVSWMLPPPSSQCFSPNNAPIALQIDVRRQKVQKDSAID